MRDLYQLVNIHVYKFIFLCSRNRRIGYNKHLEESWLMESSHSQNVEEDMIPYSQVLECVELDFYKI